MNQISAKPFLKWAGGKSQLLDKFEAFFPKELITGRINRYFEPLLGAGAVFFHIAQKYQVQYGHLSDVNEELILTYKVVQRNVDTLIEVLEKYSKKYLTLSQNERKEFFYEIRNNFNKQRLQINYEKYSENWIPRAAQMIFLNRTCYNGLFRMNKNGEFNVPFGSYKNPKILQEDNLTRAAEILSIADIELTDFSSIKNKVTTDSFVYYDPPYRPISETSSFTAYSKYDFDDNEQIRLANLFKELDRIGVKQMLSNSDPKNIDPKDNFFEGLYHDYKIYKVPAARMINCKGESRGDINELVIINYET